jgi:hypothetical protein
MGRHVVLSVLASKCARSSAGFLVLSMVERLPDDCVNNHRVLFGALLFGKKSAAKM